MSTIDAEAERIYDQLGRGEQTDVKTIRAALLSAEKRGEERNKEFWQQWARKRLDISRTQWLRAAKRALAGDMRDLRLRADLAEAPPMEIVASSAAIRGS